MKIKYLAVGFLLASGVFAGQAVAPKYSPTEVQTLRLQVKQRDAQIAQKDAQLAQEHFQSVLAALQAEAEKVRVENKWPETVKFDPNSLNFTETVPVVTGSTPVPAKKP